jgi:hypothetical protein
MAEFVGRVGDRVPGVFGPLDEATDVYEDWEPPMELAVDEMELTRGDDVPEEYA